MTMFGRSFELPVTRALMDADAKLTLQGRFMRWLFFNVFVHPTRLKLALLFRPNTIVIDVPYHTADTGHRSRKDDEEGHT